MWSINLVDLKSAEHPLHYWKILSTLGWREFLSTKGSWLKGQFAVLVIGSRGVYLCLTRNTCNPLAISLTCHIATCRHFKLWRCQGDSPVLEYGKVGSSTPSGQSHPSKRRPTSFSYVYIHDSNVGFIILSFGTTVEMEENLTSKSKNGIYLKVLLSLHCIMIVRCVVWPFKTVLDCPQTPFAEDDTAVKRLSGELPSPGLIHIQ